MIGRGARHPVIVAEGHGQVVGWGSLNSFNPRPVYVERRWHGQGVGRRLLEQLMILARTLGYHKLVRAAFPINKASTALYERLGFTPVGIYHDKGSQIGDGSMS